MQIREHIIADNLLSYLKFNNLISLEQYRFLECHFTETQLLETLNEWTLALDKSMFFDCVFIDFTRLLTLYVIMNY